MLGSSYETEFEIWACFDKLDNFKFVNFLYIKKKIMDGIYFRLIKEGNNCLSNYRYILENLQFFESQFYAGTSWGMIWAPGSNLDLTVMAFCYQNCSDLLWEKIVIVIEKNFWNSRLKAENLQFIQTLKGQNGFLTCSCRFFRSKKLEQL